MVKHTQTIRLQKPTNCLSVFGHFVGFAIKGLRSVRWRKILGQNITITISIFYWDKEIFLQSYNMQQ